VLPAADRAGRGGHEVVPVLFVRPDVAAVKARQRYESPEDGGEGAPLYVMARQGDGRRLLVAGRNTRVVVTG
jgi:hypothetical protein